MRKDGTLALKNKSGKTKIFKSKLYSTSRGTTKKPRYKAVA